MTTEHGLRILWKSNAPHVGSGYGVQANSLLPRLAQHPLVEEIGIFGYYGIQGGLCELPVGLGIPGVTPVNLAHYPVAGDLWGNDVIAEHARHFQADVVITLMDVWVLNDDYGHNGFLWCPYAPVDHDPIPPPVLDKLRRAFHPIAYSKHAAAEFARNGLDHHYIPHGVETALYKPYDAGGKAQAKEWLGFPRDAFVIGTVAANRGWPSRKGLPELVEAFARFHAKHPESRLYIHSQVVDGAHNGPHLQHLARHYGVADKVKMTTPYLHSLGLSTQDMRRLYNSFDVFCLPSMGEGFGIPLIEAQACGVPVITTDWTACAELCGSGWLVPIDKKIYTPLRSYQAFADVDALTAQMGAAYEEWLLDKAAWAQRQAAARLFALQYDWSTLVREQWFPFVDWLAERVQVKTIRRPDVARFSVERSGTVDWGDGSTAADPHDVERRRRRESTAALAVQAAAE